MQGFMTASGFREIMRFAAAVKPTESAFDRPAAIRSNRREGRFPVRFLAFSSSKLCAVHTEKPSKVMTSPTQGFSFLPPMLRRSSYRAPTRRPPSQLKRSNTLRNQIIIISFSEQLRLSHHVADIGRTNRLVRCLRSLALGMILTRMVLFIFCITW